MATERNATVSWEGNLAQGSGKLTAGSGALGDPAITWSSRIGRSEGRTSPEELLAAAHAACFAMVFSYELTQNGTIPQKLAVNAVCTIDHINNIFVVTTMKISVEGEVPGIDEATFVHLAEETAATRPISEALKGNVTIEVHARLKEA